MQTDVHRLAPLEKKECILFYFSLVLEHINDVHGCKHWVANPKELVWATHTFARLESIKYSAINKCRITSNIVLYLIKLFLPYYCYYFVSIIFGWLNLTCKYWVLFLKISILVLLNHFSCWVMVCKFIFLRKNIDDFSNNSNGGLFKIHLEEYFSLSPSQWQWWYFLEHMEGILVQLLFIMAMVSNFSFFLQLTWKFLDLESEYGIFFS
jgi:hypothetical protein